MNSFHHFRRDAAVLVAAVLLCWTAWTTARAAMRPVHPLPASTAFVELRDRVEPLRHVVSPHETVGYASARVSVDHLLALRHALAPLAIDTTDRHRLVIAEFDTDADLRAYIRRDQVSVRQHVAPGLAILERRTEVDR